MKKLICYVLLLSFIINNNCSSLFERFTSFSKENPKTSILIALGTLGIVPFGCFIYNNKKNNGGYFSFYKSQKTNFKKNIEKENNHNYEIQYFLKNTKNGEYVAYFDCNDKTVSGTPDDALYYTKDKEIIYFDPTLYKSKIKNKDNILKKQIMNENDILQKQIMNENKENK
jgi:hypothetical protein